jgi:hypothetical protein
MEWNRRRIMPLFLADNGIVYLPTARFVWDQQLLADMHDRMPVILPPMSYDLWLDPGFRDLATTSELLKTYDAGRMRRYAASTRVNNVPKTNLIVRNQLNCQGRFRPDFSDVTAGSADCVIGARSRLLMVEG